MMKTQGIAISIIALFLTISFNALVSAAEPIKPTVDQTFDFEKEAKIQEIKNLSLHEVFTTLCAQDFIIDEAFMHKAIYTAFAYRKEEAVAYAMGYLGTNQDTTTGAGLEASRDRLYVAKTILQVFPQLSASSMVNTYPNSNAVTKGNIIRAAGIIAGGEAIRSLLIQALDDKTFCEEINPEVFGDPLRICDVAYNQLVLRYKIKNALRTIGTGHSIETRDGHIQLLKSRLSEADS